MSYLNSNAPTLEGSFIDAEPKEQTTPLTEDVIPEKSIKDHLLIIFFCFCVAFGGFIFGFDTGTISGFVNLPDFKDRFGQDIHGVKTLTDTRTGVIVSIFNIGCAVGGVVLSKVADMKGRRFGLMFAMVIYVVGIIVQISAQTAWYQIVIGRAITGISVGIVTVVAPMLIGETAPKTLRGTLVVCFQLFITLGLFLGNCTVYGTKRYQDSRSWRIPLGLCFAWAIFLVAGMLLMPESPRYLVEKDNLEEARVSVGRSNNLPPDSPAVFAEVQLIQAGVLHERLAGSASWSELLTGKPKIFHRLALGVILQSLQQLTGDNYFFYYGTTIFKAVGLNDSFQTAIVIGLINFASTFMGIYVIEKFGRRQCLLAGAAAMVVCFVIYSVLGSVHLYQNGSSGPTNKPTGNAMIFITCLYIFFFASTWAGGVYCIVSEIYPLRVRSKAMSIAQGANWLWGFLISFFTPFITSAIHFYYGFVFAGCLVFSFFFIYFFVMETKGLSLEEVDDLYASGVNPIHSSKWIPAIQTENASIEVAQESKQSV